MKQLSTTFKVSLAAAAFVMSSNVMAAGLVFANPGSAWDSGNNHLMMAGGTISASNKTTDHVAYTGNPALDNAAWGHLGTWYTFMNHHALDTTVSVDSAMSDLGMTVWRTEGEFDGGTQSSGEMSSASKGTPHSFNQTGNAGDIGTKWMTDNSLMATDPSNTGTANGILETLGYANSGAAQSFNGWGNSVGHGAFDTSLTNTYETGVTGTASAGHIDLTLSNLANGWYLVFIGGSNKTQAGQTFNLTVSQVPVPAAVYLFGSALVGLVSVGRRKNVA
ncbi:MAG: hypothetical protein QM500_16340 [Methylococcales bacterium]